MAETEQERNTGSIYSFNVSLVLLGLLAFFSASYAATALAGFATATFVLMLGLRAWGRVALWRLEATLSLENDRLFSGELLTLRAAITNHKIIPVWLRMEFDIPAALAPVTATGADGETGLLPFSSAHGAWTFRAEQRGVYQPGQAMLIAGDILGICRSERELPLRKSIVVFPRLVPLAELESTFQDFFGINAAKGIIEDPAWYEGTREYSGNRPARNIHWKASARFNVLHEKIFEPTSQQKVFLILDGCGFEEPEYAGRFETALEILASLASRFAETGASFTFATDRRVRGFPGVLPLGRGPEHLGMVLELLARCDSSREPSRSPMLGSVAGAATGSTAGAGSAGFIVLCRSRTQALLAHNSMLATRRSRMLSIVADEGDLDERIDAPVLTFQDILRHPGSR